MATCSDGKLDAVALGELLIDFACIDSDSDGYPTLHANPGGAPANYLAAIQAFGGRTAMLGKVGNDTFGRLLVKTLEEKGISSEGIAVDDDVFTTLAFVTFTKERDRVFSFSRKPGADTCLRADEVRDDLIGKARVFHFGTLSLTDEPSRSATMHAVSCARQKGCLISFDPNLRKMLWKDLEEARRMMLWGLEQSDVVKISDEEAEFLFGKRSDSEYESIILGKGARLLYITKGRNGVFYSNGAYSGSMGIYDAGKPLDTTGAGDIFGGSAMHAFLSYGKAPEELDGEELRAIAAFATVSSGLSTMRHGGISSIPERDDVLEHLRRFEGKR